MNYKMIALSATALAAMSFSISSVRADGASDPTSDLTKIYSRLDDAASHKDIASCMAALSPDFMLLNLDGNVENSDGQRSHLEEIFGQFSQLDVTTKIEKCDYTQKTATVEISQHVKATEPSSDGSRPVVLEGDLTARELWSKGPDGWKMDLAQSLTAGQLTPDPQN